MALRASSLQSTNTLAINREIGSQYDVILEVSKHLVEIDTLANEDINGLINSLNEAKDFTGITVVTGETPSWDAVNKVLTVTTEKGDTGADGRGIVDIELTSTVGLTKTYTINYTDATSSTFTVINGANGANGVAGKSVYQLWLDAGNVGTLNDFLEDMKGPEGNTGPQGIGIQGPAGIDGRDLTVEQISYDGDGTFTWQFSDGTSYTTPDMRGPQGATGLPGVKGDTGQGVHHIKGTSTTNPNGDFGTSTFKDTYTLYGDAAETINLGHFTVANGVSDGMSMEIYDTNHNGIVDNSERLGGELPGYYVNTVTTQTIDGVKTFSSTITGSISGNATTANKWTTARTIALNGDVAGSVSVDGSADVIIATTIQPNSVNLGTDTTGNYMVNVTAGSGISVSHTQGEGSTATITNSAPNVTTNITTTHTSTNVVVNSSDGTDGTINSATQTLAGVMSAADKTKLDGIEAGATGDQTASEILTLLKTVDGSGSGIDADLLDGQEGAYYLNASNINTGTINDSYLPNTITSDITGNAATTTKLATARTISLTGDVTGNVSFDGSTNVSITATVADDSHNHIISNVDGLQTALDSKLGASANAVSATKLQTARTIAGVSFDGTADISIPFSGISSKPTTVSGYGLTDVYTKTESNASLNLKVNSSEKGVANGIATLDTNGKVILTQIPDSVLGQLEYMGTWNLTTLPTATQKGQYWIASVSGNGYVVGDWAVWNGTAFDKVDNTDAVATVAGRTGNVVLTKSDVDLSLVDNTADASKNVLSATKWTTSRTIALVGDVAGSVSVDGSENVTITTTVQPNSVALGTDTTGNYVANVTAGTGIAVTGTAGEGWSPTVALTNVGTAGTYRSVTTDAQGRIIAGTNPTTVAGYGLTDVYTKTESDTALALKAPLASPALTGTPTAPTASVGTNTTQVATTAYVVAEINKIEEW